MDLSIRKKCKKEASHGKIKLFVPNPARSRSHIEAWISRYSALSKVLFLENFPDKMANIVTISRLKPAGIWQPCIVHHQNLSDTARLKNLFVRESKNALIIQHFNINQQSSVQVTLFFIFFFLICFLCFF